MELVIAIIGLFAAIFGLFGVVIPFFKSKKTHHKKRDYDPKIWALYEQYNNPAILDSRFKPLFKRLLFLENIDDSSDRYDLIGKGKELCDFISNFEKGERYCEKIKNLTKNRHFIDEYIMHMGGDESDPDPEDEAKIKRYEQEYRDQLRNARKEIYELIITELLPYQNWETKKSI